MLFAYLDKVRRWSPAARQQFALWVAVGVTVGVATIWGFSLPARLSSIQVGGSDMMASTGMQELGDEADKSIDGVQDIIDTVGTLPSQMPEEVRNELMAQGFIVAGSESDDENGATDDEATSTAGSSTVESNMEPKPIMIVAVPSASTSPEAP